MYYRPGIPEPFGNSIHTSQKTTPENKPTTLPSYGERPKPGYNKPVTLPSYGELPKQEVHKPTTLPSYGEKPPAFISILPLILLLFFGTDIVKK